MTMASIASRLPSFKFSIFWASISFFTCSATWACLVADERTKVAEQGIGLLSAVSVSAGHQSEQTKSAIDLALSNNVSPANLWLSTEVPRERNTHYLNDLMAAHMAASSASDSQAQPDYQTLSTGDDTFTAIPIHPGHSGAWSSPERDGEGVQVEILSATRALVFWFTYRAQGDVNPGQFWMGGTGNIVGNQIIIDDVVSTSGPVFGPDFDPTDVVRTPWGRFVLEFNSCQGGRILYEGPAEFGAGTIPLQRLTANPRVPCGADTSDFVGPSMDVPGVSGNWFDPTHDGEGWFIQEIAPGIAGFSWLSYDDNGDQVWMLGVGFWRGRSLIVPTMQITDGASFGEAFQVDDVERNEWGAVQFVFDSCDSATLVYNSPIPGFGSGVLRPERLTRSDFVPCAFDELSSLANGSWQLQGGAPELSEVPSTVLRDDIYIAGGFRNGFRSRREFWRYTPATGVWQQLADLPQARDHGMMSTFNDQIYFFGGSVDGGALATAWRYLEAQDQWEFLPTMPNARSAGGAVVLNDFIYVLGGEPDFIDRFDPQAEEWVSLPLPEITGRDHSAAVAYQDEIWLMAGRRDGAAHGFIIIYNPLTGVVRSAPAINRARSGFAATVINGQILVAGGENFIPLETTATAEYYSPENREWRPLPSIPSAVHGVSGVTFDGRVYLMPGSISTGGVNNQGQIQIYTPQ